jgi:hypothetical protein
LIEHLIRPQWSLFRLVLLASGLCIPLIPWLWQYSRVIWIYFDRYFDPDDAPDEVAPGHPPVVEEPTRGLGADGPAGNPADGHLE